MNVHMGQWQGIRLVASREISTRLHSRAYRISTLVLLLMIVTFTIIMKFVNGATSGETVGYTAPNAQLAVALEASAKAIGTNVTIKPVAGEPAGRDELSGGSLDALLAGDGSRVQVVVKGNLDEKLRGALNVVAGRLALDQQIIGLGGDPARVNAAVANAGIEVTPLEQPHQYNAQQLVLGIIAGVLIYLSLLMNGQAVAQGVVEEKTSRVVELLLATIRPWQLLVGKVLGIGVVGLLQMLVFAVVGVVAALSLGVLTISASAAAGTVAWLIAWYLLGFVMYSIVFAGLGALVSRQEEVSGVVTPALMFVIAGYIVGISILPSNPGSRLAEVLSIIPLFAPTIMPMRLAMGGVPAWEATVSVALVVVLIPMLIWLSGRIYRNAVLRTGARVKLRDALRAA